MICVSAIVKRILKALFAPSVPVAVSAADGAVLSSLTVTGVASVVIPASFVHEPVKSSPVVSSVCCCSAVQVTGPLIASVPLVAIVTSLVRQPFAPRVPAVTASVQVRSRRL